MIGRSFACAVLLLLSSAALGSVEAGAAKWRAGDWDGAVADWATPAARGDADALFNMGQAHRLGRGVPQNLATAVDYYRRAADKGHVGATASLGITLWQQGRKTEALTQLRTAADRGDLRASYVLGVATFEGDVAPRNVALGYAYVVRAREGGLALASGQAARMATRMTAEPEERADADSEDTAEDPTGEAVAAAPARPTRGQPARADAADTKAGAEKPSAPAGTGWRVQLGAYANERAARTAWATLVSQSAALLKGQAPIYNPRGGLVRLQVGPFEARPEAAELCAKLAAAGRPCFVTG
jgi:uncharacterized protein